MQSAAQDAATSHVPKPLEVTGDRLSLRSPDVAQVPSARASVLSARALLALQRTVGNGAVVNLVTKGVPGPDGLRPPLETSDHVADAPFVAQRQPQTGDASATQSVTWSASGDSTFDGKDVVCTDKAQAATVLLQLASLLRSQGEALDDSANQALSAMADQVTKDAQPYTSGGALEASDPGYLTGYVTIAQGLMHQQIEAAVSRCLSAITVPGSDDESYQHTLDDLAEQSHRAFIAANKDALKPVMDAITVAQSLHDTIKGYTDKVKKVDTLLHELSGVAKLAEISEKVAKVNEGFGEQVEAAKSLFENAKNVATLVGIDGTSNGTATMESINQFEAGIALVDTLVGKFGKSVPIFGDLWSKWYQPMIEACIKGLRVIAAQEEYQGRELELAGWFLQQAFGEVKRDASGAPVLSDSAIQEKLFPGGQPVLDYVYAIRKGGAPQPSAEVRDFFLDRKDLFNISEPQKSDQLSEGDWSLLSPSTWFRSGRKDDVATWVPAHIDKVWGLLYGELGQYIP
jgi:hypothetical protein